MLIKEFTLKEDEVSILANELKNIIANRNYIVILRGDLASGKTTFVKKYVESLGLDDVVNSPTFSIQVKYSSNIFHYDLYNKTLEEFLALGMLEEFEKEGTHFVEWGSLRLEEILNDYGFDVIVIDIKKKEESRVYKVYA
jgi:tRNA threonylcarbamoyladenosine biosynthesis protein TsaE